MQAHIQHGARVGEVGVVCVVTKSVDGETFGGVKLLLCGVSRFQLQIVMKVCVLQSAFPTCYARHAG